MAVIVKMPDGGIESVKADSLLWMRVAFADEWNGAIMLQLDGRRLYSSASLAELESGFSNAGAKLAHFTPPDVDISMIVNATNVVKIEPNKYNMYHPAAGSVLKFGPDTRLAIRESIEKARTIIDAAKNS